MTKKNQPAPFVRKRDILVGLGALLPVIGGTILYIYKARAKSKGLAVPTDSKE